MSSILKILITILFFTLLLHNTLLSFSSENNSAVSNSRISEYSIDSILNSSRSSAIKIDSLIDVCKSIGNSTCLFTIKIQLSKWHSAEHNMSEAFNNGTEALEIANSINDSLLIARASSHLGVLHNYFTKTNEAEKLLLKSNNLYNKLLLSGKAHYSELIANYYSLIQLYQWFDSTHLALAYIDTCNMLAEKYELNDTDRIFFEAEYAKALTKSGKADSAITLLNNELMLIESIDSSNIDLKRFVIIVYLFLGDAHLAVGNYDSAIQHYNNCNYAIGKYNFNKGYRVNTHKNLSKAYSHIGDFQEAYKNLKIMSDLNDKYFSTRSTYNADLIKINNKYKELLDKQRIELLEKQKHLLIFRVLIIAIILLVVAAILFYRIRLQKLKLQKRNEQVEFEKKESDQQLRIRNKELTEHTLKLIEKETILKEMAAQLKKVAPKDKESINMVKSALGDSKVLWEEFNTNLISK